MTDDKGERRNPFTKASSGVEVSDDVLREQLAARERRRAAAKRAERPRASFDLPPRVVQAVQAAAVEEDVSYSDIVAWALVEFLERRRAGQGTDLDPHKTAARSLRFAYRLILPDEWE